jgi:hypothetical protein
MKKYVVWIFLALHVIVPVFTLAQDGGGNESRTFNFIPCKGPDCTFCDLVTLINTLIRFFIYISVPLAVISFIYAGFLYMTAQGNPGQITKAHGFFTKTLWGFVIILSAWLIVYTITNALLDPSKPFSLLGSTNSIQCQK